MHLTIGVFQRNDFVAMQQDFTMLLSGFLSRRGYLHGHLSPIELKARPAKRPRTGNDDPLSLPERNGFLPSKDGSLPCLLLR